MRKNLLFGFLLLVFHVGLLLGQVRQVWVASYNSPGIGTSKDNHDRASAIAVDAAGNVYVTGRSTGVDTNSDYATVKYDPDGNQLWVARYDGPGDSIDKATAIALDALGNVYVTGGSTGAGTDLDYATIKYDADGNQLWAARYNGPGNGHDLATALAVDADGNVYVTGESYGLQATNLDYATIKYDPDGQPLWVARYDGPGSYWDTASALALDAQGNVFVTGGSVGVNTYQDYATIKYDADGNQLWVARYDGPGHGSDLATALALDADGNVYVTGASQGADYDYATIKYDADGNQLWVARYDGPGHSFDVAYALAVDALGNVHVTGASWNRGTDLDYATIKYNANGSQQWVARYDGPHHAGDIAWAVAVDTLGNVYVTGQSIGSVSTYEDYATIKYDADGNQLWLYRYNGPASGPDAAHAIALDTLGNVYVTGASCLSGPYPRCMGYATIKYVQK